MKAKFAHLNAHLELRWKSDFQKDVIIENFKDRKWEAVDEDEGNLMANKTTGTFIGLVSLMYAKFSIQSLDLGFLMISRFS